MAAEDADFGMAGLGNEEDADYDGASADEGGSAGLGVDDFGSLISFANLENVVKHIIKKFKSIEAHNDSSDESIKGLRTQLETRATNDVVSEVQMDLANKVDNFNKMFAGQKESIASLEIQFERSRVMCNAIEKKLEASVKEKAVQDRLIRETHDALQDKVAVAELNMFEAKFAGYTTKSEHHEGINQFSQYARLDVAERIAESVKVLATSFDDYARTAKVEQHLQELRDWVDSELQGYAKARPTCDKIEELQTFIGDQSRSFERVHITVDDKLRGLSDRVTSIYTELNSDLEHRAPLEDLREIRDSLRKYAVKAETDAFQQDCVPKLRFCVESIQAFDDRLRAQDDAIQRVDEVLLDKAAKYDIVVLNAKVEACYQLEAGAKEFMKMYERLDWMKRKMEQYMDNETERLDQFRPPDYTPMFEDLNARISLKADKADLVEMYQLKANRIDSDELAKLQDTIHRQLEYLSVTAFGLAKLVLTESRAGESKSIRTQQKNQVLMQSEALWHWILHNEPPPNLDTLRPPPARGRRGNDVAAKPAGGGALEGGSGGCETSDKEKRLMDDSKRLQLEKKFGLQGGS